MFLRFILTEIEERNRTARINWCKEKKKKYIGFLFKDIRRVASSRAEILHTDWRRPAE